MKRWLAAVVVAVVACQGVDLSGGAALSSVTYRLAWDTDGIELTDDGWRVTTDLGYEVEVTRAYLVTYAVQLAPCETTELAGLLSVSTAWAGHGGDVDESVAGNLIESFARPQTIELGPITFQRATYCRVHYLVAAPDSNTSRLPDDVGMEATSFYLDGRYRAPGDSGWSPFVVRGADATAALEELADVGDVESLAGERATVEVTRSLATLLHGVDFAAGDNDDMAWEVAANLRHDVVLRVVLH